MYDNPVENFSMLICCVPMLLFIGAFIALVVFLLSKASKDVWAGEIIDKKFNTHRDMDSNREETNYYVVVKKSNGKISNVAVAESEYKEFKVGDCLVKNKGELKPKKV